MPITPQDIDKVLKQLENRATRLSRVPQTDHIKKLRGDINKVANELMRIKVAMEKR